MLRMAGHVRRWLSVVLPGAVMRSCWFMSTLLAARDRTNGCYRVDVLSRANWLDVAVKREVEEETGLAVRSVGSLAFGTQHYAPGRDQPLLFLAFNVDLGDVTEDSFTPDDPDDLIIEARFVPVQEAIDLVLSAGVFPGSQSTADFLRQGPGDGPTFSLWDLNRYADGPIARLPADHAPAGSARQPDGSDQSVPPQP